MDAQKSAHETPSYIASGAGREFGGVGHLVGSHTNFEEFQMSTNNENAARASGIYELARPHLTANRDAFASGDPAWLVSAWKHLLKGSPEDVNFEGERAGILFEAIVGDIGEDAAFSGLDEVYESHGRAMTCIELARAYGAEEWPRLAMRDYLYAFDGMDEETAEAASIRAWANARIIYDARKSSKESEGLAA